MNPVLQFAAEQASSSGLGALGINLQGFLFQLITFVIVLLVLRKFVYQRLVDTLETRRKAVVDSLDNAKEAAAALEKSNEKAAELLKEARKEAADIVALAKKEANKVSEDVEAKAAKKAEHLIEQAEARIHSDIAAARQGLQTEMVGLVIAATEKVIEQKLDAKQDTKLIKEALTETR
ncbi:TPA: ATP synthase F0 subunit B [Candidatus Saccharibacteria bacterium]|nr:ATP synthase F0 subunit B [Candidatus Saccharibacteria bacterium]HRK41074.1 F0F1 ATP synthase subunit B [Candidatus Saccharibacteria bacterium]